MKKKSLIISIIAILIIGLFVVWYIAKGKDTKPSNEKTTSNVNTISDENEGETGFTYIPVSTPTPAPTYTPIPTSTPVPTNTPIPTPEESGRKILVGDEEYTFIPMSKIMYVIEDEDLWMGPSVKYEMGDHVSKGTKVSVIGELVDYEHWYVILYKGKYQFIWKVSLSDIEPTPTPEVMTWGDNGEYTFTEINKLMYTTESVNLRQGPSTSYDKTCNAPKGDPVHVVAKCNENEWYMVYYMGSVHFVESKYISEVAPTSTPTPKPTATPKPTRKPTPTPKPTPVVVQLEKVVVDGVEGAYFKGIFVPVTTAVYQTDTFYNPDYGGEGKYIDGKFVLKENLREDQMETFLILVGLEDCEAAEGLEIPLDSAAEQRAWMCLYPNAGYRGIINGNTFMYVIPNSGDGGPLGGGSLDLKAN